MSTFLETIQREIKKTENERKKIAAFRPNGIAKIVRVISTFFDSKGGQEAIKLLSLRDKSSPFFENGRNNYYFLTTKANKVEFYQRKADEPGDMSYSPGYRDTNLTITEFANKLFDRGYRGKKQVINFLKEQFLKLA